MTKTEIRSVSAITLIYALRMLGLAMIMPVFMLLSSHLEGYTESLAGLAIGAYGLSQALLQIPYGMLSDRIGRKPLIGAGLALFCLGSVIAALSSSIYGVILGRILQGSGAVAGVLMALVSDVTSEESRTKAMATIGVGVGVAFSLSLVIGPMLGHALGLSGLFGATAVFGVIAMAVLIFLVPTPPRSATHSVRTIASGQLPEVLGDGSLLRLDYGVMTLHLTLVAFFVTVPSILYDQLGIAKAHHAWVYLSVVVPAFLTMLPFLILAEKKKKMKEVLAGAVLLMALSLALLAFWHRSFAWVWVFLFMFFLAFNLLEASLPSLVSKQCRREVRGTAMGVYSTSQFLGAFLGGAVGGLTLQHFGTTAELMTLVIFLLAWFSVVCSMPRLGRTSSMTGPRAS